ncbi:MAG: type II toxin-antitoxin system death-on-curing family toxin [Candidatus Rokubacteria bacterium]|nr:type II toxin-antitoxin system death-on-curing family toxin [Candidatus Rokubacteria bacterium]
MMRYLTLGEVVELHRLVLGATGGAPGIRDLGALESAIAQPKTTFGGTDLYPTLIEKAAALCFALVQGHPFVDGNKRVGHAAMETFLVLNGTEITASVDKEERLMLDLAAGRTSRGHLTDWLRQHVKPPTGS